MTQVSASSTVALLDADPELGAALPEAELPDARRLLVVPAVSLDAGPWEIEACTQEPSLGLLLLDGLVTVNVMLGDRIASQLAGPGDVLDGSTVPDLLLPATVSHFVSERARVAVLDRRFIAAVRRWPALLLSLHERLRVRERRQAIHAAIGKLQRVEDRILALLWHLAERWGRGAADGVVLPLALTPDTLGRLAGADPPAVSLALTELERAGDVLRRPDGAFLLREASRHRLESMPAGPRHVQPLTVVRTVDAGWVPDAGTGRRPALVDIVALSRRIAALHDELPERTRGVEQLLASSRARAEESTALRAQAAANRDRRQPD